ncbi:PREDICTED: mucin-2-like [Branchiostoma belcheri]|uniref:Mucin-2-like n=1 Tax=Branchiostoma belcheri TaxID=7741 RepID=A0A6P4XKA7_BRABE|nr:PREDICTED: mucin-2-like [Branchiostoma belcheri]
MIRWNKGSKKYRYVVKESERQERDPGKTDRTGQEAKASVGSQRYSTTTATHTSRYGASGRPYEPPTRTPQPGTAPRDIPSTYTGGYRGATGVVPGATATETGSWRDKQHGGLGRGRSPATTFIPSGQGQYRTARTDVFSTTPGRSTYRQPTRTASPMRSSTDSRSRTAQFMPTTRTASPMRSPTDNRSRTAQFGQRDRMEGDFVVVPGEMEEMRQGRYGNFIRSSTPAQRVGPSGKYTPAAYPKPQTIPSAGQSVVQKSKPTDVPPQSGRDDGRTPSGISTQPASVALTTVDDGAKGAESAELPLGTATSLTESITEGYVVVPRPEQETCTLTVSPDPDAKDKVEEETQDPSSPHKRTWDEAIGTEDNGAKEETPEQQTEEVSTVQDRDQKISDQESQADDSPSASDTVDVGAKDIVKEQEAKDSRVPHKRRWDEALGDKVKEGTLEPQTEEVSTFSDTIPSQAKATVVTPSPPPTKAKIRRTPSEEATTTPSSGTGSQLQPTVSETPPVHSQDVKSPPTLPSSQQPPVSYQKEENIAGEKPPVHYQDPEALPPSSQPTVAIVDDSLVEESVQPFPSKAKATVVPQDPSPTKVKVTRKSSLESKPLPEFQSIVKVEREVTPPEPLIQTDPLLKNQQQVRAQTTDEEEETVQTFGPSRGKPDRPADAVPSRAKASVVVPPTCPGVTASVIPSAGEGQEPRHPPHDDKQQSGDQRPDEGSAYPPVLPPAGGLPAGDNTTGMPGSTLPYPSSDQPTMPIVPQPLQGTAQLPPHPEGLVSSPWQLGVGQPGQGPSYPPGAPHAPYPPGPLQQAPYPPGPGTKSPYPPGQASETPYPPGPTSQAPYPPGPATESPYPPGPATESPYPPGPATESSYPPGPATESPYPPGPATESPYPPGPATESPYPPGPATESSYPPGSTPDVPYLPSPATQTTYPPGPTTEAPYPPGQAPDVPYPATQAPYPPGPGSQAPHPPGPASQVPYPPGQGTQAPYPPGPTTEVPYPQGPAPDATYPPGPASQTPYPPGTGTQAPYPPSQASQAPYPPGPAPNAPYPPGQVPASPSPSPFYTPPGPAFPYPARHPPQEGTEGTGQEQPSPGSPYPPPHPAYPPPRHDPAFPPQLPQGPYPSVISAYPPQAPYYPQQPSETAGNLPQGPYPSVPSAYPSQVPHYPQQTSDTAGNLSYPPAGDACYPPPQPTTQHPGQPPQTSQLSPESSSGESQPEGARPSVPLQPRPPIGFDLVSPPGPPVSQQPSSEVRETDILSPPPQPEQSQSFQGNVQAADDTSKPDDSLSSDKLEKLSSETQHSKDTKDPGPMSPPDKAVLPWRPVEEIISPRPGSIAIPLPWTPTPSPEKQKAFDFGGASRRHVTVQEETTEEDSEHQQTKQQPTTTLISDTESGTLSTSYTLSDQDVPAEPEQVPTEVTQSQSDTSGQPGSVKAEDEYGYGVVTPGYEAHDKDRAPESKIPTPIGVHKPQDKQDTTSQSSGPEVLQHSAPTSTLLGKAPTEPPVSQQVDSEIRETDILSPLYTSYQSQAFGEDVPDASRPDDQLSPDKLEKQRVNFETQNSKDIQQSAPMSPPDKAVLPWRPVEEIISPKPGSIPIPLPWTPTPSPEKQKAFEFGDQSQAFGENVPDASKPDDHLSTDKLEKERVDFETQNSKDIQQSAPMSPPDKAVLPWRPVEEIISPKPGSIPIPLPWTPTPSPAKQQAFEFGGGKKRHVAVTEEVTELDSDRQTQQPTTSVISDTESGAQCTSYTLSDQNVPTESEQTPADVSEEEQSKSSGQPDFTDVEEGYQRGVVPPGFGTSSGEEKGPESKVKDDTSQRRERDDAGPSSPEVEPLSPQQPTRPVKTGSQEQYTAPTSPPDKAVLPWEPLENIISPRPGSIAIPLPWTPTASPDKQRLFEFGGATRKHISATQDVVVHDSDPQTTLPATTLASGTGAGTLGTSYTLSDQEMPVEATEETEAQSTGPRQTGFVEEGYQLGVVPPGYDMYDMYKAEDEYQPGVVASDYQKYEKPQETQSTADDDTSERKAQGLDDPSSPEVEPLSPYKPVRPTQMALTKETEASPKTQFFPQKSDSSPDGLSSSEFEPVTPESPMSPPYKAVVVWRSREEILSPRISSVVIPLPWSPLPQSPTRVRQLNKPKPTKREQGLVEGTTIFEEDPSMTQLANVVDIPQREEVALSTSFVPSHPPDHGDVDNELNKQREEVRKEGFVEEATSFEADPSLTKVARVAGVSPHEDIAVAAAFVSSQPPQHREGDNEGDVFYDAPDTTESERPAKQSKIPTFQAKSPPHSTKPTEASTQQQSPDRTQLEHSPDSSQQASSPSRIPRMPSKLPTSPTRRADSPPPPSRTPMSPTRKSTSPSKIPTVAKPSGIPTRTPTKDSGSPQLRRTEQLREDHGDPTSEEYQERGPEDERERYEIPEDLESIEEVDESSRDEKGYSGDEDTEGERLDTKGIRGRVLRKRSSKEDLLAEDEADKEFEEDVKKAPSQRRAPPKTLALPLDTSRTPTRRETYPWPSPTSPADRALLLWKPREDILSPKPGSIVIPLPWSPTRKPPSPMTPRARKRFHPPLRQLQKVLKENTLDVGPQPTPSYLGVSIVPVTTHYLATAFVLSEDSCSSEDAAPVPVEVHELSSHSEEEDSWVMVEGSDDDMAEMGAAGYTGHEKDDDNLYDPPLSSEEQATVQRAVHDTVEEFFGEGEGEEEFY